MLAPIRERRRSYAQDPAQVMQMLKRGTEEAKAVTAKTLSEVKAVIGINY